MHRDVGDVEVHDGAGGFEERGFEVEVVEAEGFEVDNIEAEGFEVDKARLCEACNRSMVCFDVQVVYFEHGSRGTPRHNDP